MCGISVASTAMAECRPLVPLPLWRSTSTRSQLSPRQWMPAYGARMRPRRICNRGGERARALGEAPRRTQLPAPSAAYLRSPLVRSKYETARAGNRRFRQLSALHTHTKVPYQMDLLGKNIRPLKRPWAARTVGAARAIDRDVDIIAYLRRGGGMGTSRDGTSLVHRTVPVARIKIRWRRSPASYL